MKNADLDNSGFITTVEYMNATNLYGPLLWNQFIAEGIKDTDLFNAFYVPLNFTESDLNKDGNVTLDEYLKA
jgi:hypothetical protein